MAADGRVAVVTGAAGAIGAAVAARLDADGFAIARTDLDDERFPCDVRDEDAVLALRDAVEQQLGSPWLLVNVAGVFFEHDVPDLPVEDYDRIVDVNLKGTFLTCKTFLPAMIEAGSGCIVNIASTAGIRGGHIRAAYCAAKAGVVALVRAMAVELRGSGVTANTVSPGSTGTPILDESARLYGLTSAEAFGLQQPLERLLRPDEVAAMLLWLAGPASSAVTGGDFPVDGGLSA